MDRMNCAAGLGMLAETFGRPLSDAMAEGYWIALKDLTDAQLATGVSRALRESKFMPTPSELRDFAGAGIKANALIAWDAVRDAMRKHGYTASVDFGPLVNAVVRNMGGWRRLDDMATAELDIWGKKEFERVYGLLALHDPSVLNGAPLRGAFAGDPVRIAIAGHVVSAQLLEGGSVLSIVRQLAEMKS